jgi:hypothetical protein
MNVIAVMGAYDRWSAVLGRARAEVKDDRLPCATTGAVAFFSKES